MKRDAIFINAARGAIHNEDDLTEALQKGLIWGAGLDVTNPGANAAGSSLCFLCRMFLFCRILDLQLKKPVLLCL